MIDLSDGLSRDLRHLCQSSGVGAIVNAAAIPIHPDAILLAARDGRAPLDHALNDGEDYELLFASPTAAIPGATPIGHLTPEADIRLESGGALAPLESKAWEHPL
jgi:thiamine-monophosphate kinase